MSFQLAFRQCVIGSWYLKNVCKELSLRQVVWSFGRWEKDTRDVPPLIFFPRKSADKEGKLQNMLFDKIHFQCSYYTPYVRLPLQSVLCLTLWVYPSTYLNTLIYISIYLALFVCIYHINADEYYAIYTNAASSFRIPSADSKRQVRLVTVPRNQSNRLHCQGNEI